MIRNAILCFCLTLALPAMAQERFAERLAGSPTLKAEAMVSSEIVRIGDLVENAGAVADVPIFRAPDLGQSGAVRASRVADAVRPHHIIGLDTHGLTEIMVIRASRAITAGDFETRIVRALAGQYGLADAKNLSVVFDNQPRTVQVDPTSAELRVARITFEPRNGRFDALLELPGSSARAQLRFTGSLTETFETLVPTRPLAQGEVLKISDLTSARRPKSEFSAGMVTDADQVVGLAVRRPLLAGRAMRQGDLQKPELVSRNDNVTISYEVPGIVLSMRGQALEGGTQGDLINVLNVQSKKTIRATIVGPGRVSVAATTPRLAANIDATPSRNSASARAE
jgi:flagella basal body P-ring formation protein FlgA